MGERRPQHRTQLQGPLLLQAPGKEPAGMPTGNSDTVRASEIRENTRAAGVWGLTVQISYIEQMLKKGVSCNPRAQGKGRVLKDDMFC